MLSKNILPKSRKSSILAVLIIINMVIYAFGACFNNVYAAQTKESYSTKINNYPGYTELIESLKKEYPNWNFTILYTGLDWNEVIKNETVANHSRNLVSSGKNSYWYCKTCANKAYDNGSWVCASEAAVSYYMDPRNWINKDYVFQFEDLSYNGNIQTIDGVNQILKGTWMSDDNISYVDTSNTVQTINKSYAQAIIEAAATVGISPYHLAARIRQEQGTSRASATGDGKQSGLIGYYNLLNINACGNGKDVIIKNALEYAKTKEWTNPEKSILGGAQFIATEYIKRGQSTLYLQKYDVDSSDGSLYYHQYMQNIEAAKSEGRSVKDSYNDMGLLSSGINFIIPVFENMPKEISKIPGTEYVVTQNVAVNGINVAIRNGAGISSSIITSVSTGENLLRIELAKTVVDGHYWDKVVLPNGTKGYIARTFINQIDDITNTNEPAVTNTGVNLRNGPGTSGTSVIITLSRGQAVTVMETGKYNGVDGYNWSRIKLANGTQGYLVSDYINIVTNGSDSTGNILATLNGNEVRLRTGVGTSNSIITTLNRGDLVTVIQRNAGTANSLAWDKIVTSSGLEGYIANMYLDLQAKPEQAQQQPASKKPNESQATNESKTLETSSTSTTPTEQQPGPIVANSNIKTENSNLICVPSTTVSDIKSCNSTAVVTKNGAVLADSELVGTGCVVTIGDSKYTIIKKGDTNGDGEVNAIDALRVLKYDIGKISITGDLLKASDVNGDTEVNTIDALKLLKFDIGSTKIIL